DDMVGPGGEVRRTRQIYLNPAFTWVDEDGPVLGDDTRTYDLRYALLHMAGHALGLGHVDDNDAVMADWDPSRMLGEHSVVVDGQSFPSFLTQSDLTE